MLLGVTCSLCRGWRNLITNVVVDECEIKVIKETFKDLCHLNGGSMRIDKETFLQYLPLPGLLGGERYRSGRGRFDNVS